MEVINLLEAVKEVLSEKRYQHTIRVMETAVELAHHYDIGDQEVKEAALLHDYAKCFSTDELQAYINQFHLPEELLSFHHELWHGPVAAEIVHEKFSIKNPDILNAIRYHTTGRVGMSLLEYIIFVADYIEPARSFPGVEEVRLMAKVNLENAARKALQNTIIYLMNQDMTVHPDSYMAYNFLTVKTKER